MEINGYVVIEYLPKNQLGKRAVVRRVLMLLLPYHFWKQNRWSNI
jgi:hypothetical protein